MMPFTSSGLMPGDTVQGGVCDRGVELVLPVVCGAVLMVGARQLSSMLTSACQTLPLTICSLLEVPVSHGIYS